MKSIYLLVLLSLSYGGISFGQSTEGKKYPVDTIFVSVHSKTYLVFSEVVDWCDVGITKYAKVIKNKSVFFIAAEKDIEPASIVVKYGDNIFHGTIAYKDKLTPDETIVDFNNFESRKSDDFVNAARVEENKEETLLSKVVDRRLGTLEGKTKDEESSIAALSDKIIFKMSLMRKDQEMYYFKLDIFNKSKIDFLVDYIDFTYKGEENGLVKKTPIPPMKMYEKNKEEGESMDVLSKEHISVYAAVRQHAVGNSGYLEITAREKKGMRILKFKVKQNILVKINEF